MRYIDMHTHTTMSDGLLTPSELIDYAVEKKLSGIAITDHDTVDGIEEAMIYSGQIDNFIVLAGIELSTELLGEEVHILGYGIDYKDKELLKLLEEIQSHRKKRIKEIVVKLQSLGLAITHEQVIECAGPGTIGRPHLAKTLLANNYVETIEEAFNKYLAKGAPAYVPRYKLHPKEAIRLIKNVRGLSVLAHPGLIKSQKIIRKVLEMNIDGIEVHHPDHTWEERCRFEDIARENRLFITAGSDFHGPKVGAERHGDLASEKISEDYIKSLLGKCEGVVDHRG